MIAYDDEESAAEEARDLLNPPGPLDLLARSWGYVRFPGETDAELQGRLWRIAKRYGRPPPPFLVREDR